jgi:RNA polymerase sigma factor (sigma-70 family)
MEQYLNQNYNQLLKKFKSFCYMNYKSIPHDIIENIYHDTIILLIQCRANRENTIEDYKTYFWRMLMNETSNYYKKSKKSLVSYNDLFPFSDLLNDISENKSEAYMKEDWLKTLNNHMKDALTQLEYHIFISFTYNKMNSIQIANQIGYSKATVYQKKKSIFDKIKKEMKDNEERYYNL